MPSTLVRYSATTAGRSLAMAAYRNRHAIAKGARVFMAARKLQRTWRKFKKSPAKSHRREIGENVQRNEKARVVATINSDSTVNCRSLQSYDMSVIPEGSSPEQRDRNIAFVSGFKLCLELRNLNAEALNINVAVVSPKKAQNVTVANFFRGFSNERGADFDNAGLSANDYKCRPINADLYSILMHKRINLNGIAPISTKKEYGATYGYLDTYIKLGRQLRFERTAVNVELCTTPIFLIMWCDVVGRLPSQGAIQEPVPGFAMQRKVNCYFKHVK